MSPTSVPGTNNFHFSGRAMLVLLGLTMTHWDQGQGISPFPQGYQILWDEEIRIVVV